MTNRPSKDLRNLKTRTVRHPDRVGVACAPWTLLLPDAAEGLLTDAEQRALDQHLAGCSACTEELSEAQRGLAWLTVLKDQAPEPPSTLLASILAQTTGLSEAGVALPELLPHAVPVMDPVFPEVSVGAWRDAGLTVWSWLRGEPGTWSTLLQPRLVMTGAMAFFSICLTLNLLGISVTQLDAQTQHKGGIHRTMADTSASIARSIHGLRVVYRVQSHVSEMRAAMDGPGSRSTE